jgi:hypothetical protein
MTIAQLARLAKHARGKVDAVDASGRSDCLAQEREILPGAAAYVEDAVTVLEAQAIDRVLAQAGGRKNTQSKNAMMSARQPAQGLDLNYIRNSVKVVVEAYNGTVDFYLIDSMDPIAATYQRIFPGLFKPFATMPTGLQKHIRYRKRSLCESVSWILRILVLGLN